MGRSAGLSRSVYLRHEQILALEEAAQKEGRSFSALVARAVRWELVRLREIEAQREQRQQPTREAARG